MEGGGGHGPAASAKGIQGFAARLLTPHVMLFLRRVDRITFEVESGEASTVSLAQAQ